MKTGSCCEGQFAQMLFICFAAFVMVSGCASTEKKECANAAWFNIGYRDGLRGYPASRIDVHRKACFAYDVRLDALLYEQGRIRGLREFCLPRNGYFLGSHGYIYNGQCRGDAESDFLKALDLGRKQYYLELTEKNEQRLLSRACEELETIKQEIAQRQADLVQEGIGANPEAGRRLIGDVETLLDRQRELHVRINAHQKRLEAIRQDLKILRLSKKNSLRHP